MLYLSKSGYCNFWQCPKMAWLNKYKPEVKTEDPGLQALFDKGNEVGDLAMGLFGDFVEVTAMKDGHIDIHEMVRRTQEEMAKGTTVICEASFIYKGLYCAVDILRKDGDGWAIYEVKSSTNNDEVQEKKSVYMADISYQKYVLEHCGVNVTSTYLVSINNKYVRGEQLDLNELFYVLNVSEEVDAELPNVEKNLRLAEEILSSDEEPDYDLDLRCADPYACPYWDYCARDIPNPSVFDLYRLRFDRKMSYYHNGLADFKDLLDSGIIRNAKQLRQIEYALEDKGTYTEPENIRKFLDKLSYPLYFLDYETMQPAIPKFPGTKPYQQIPFQYSLHYIEHEGGELKHTEFLAISGEDPRRSIAESLVRDIPMDVCITAYNKRFECDRTRELAAMFPDLAEHLLNIADHIVDLLFPFQSGYYYNRSMGGSFSIKSVLPAIFPDDPSLNYHNLDEVHNGTEAMTIFPMIQYMSEEEQKETRHNLLKYCELDTYAMVKVWEELVRVAEE